MLNMERPLAGFRPLGPFMSMSGDTDASQHVRTHLSQSSEVSEEALEGVVAMIQSSDDVPYDVDMGDVFTETRESSGVVHVVTGANELHIDEVMKIEEFVENASGSTATDIFVNYH